MGNSQLFAKAFLVFVVISHWAIIVGNGIAFLILPFYTDWYIALPLMSYIGLLTFSRVLDCPLTKLENKVRKNLGMSEVKGFIGHYAIKPYYNYKRNLNARRRAAKREKTPLDIQIPSMKQLAKFKLKGNSAERNLILEED